MESYQLCGIYTYRSIILYTDLVILIGSDSNKLRFRECEGFYMQLLIRVLFVHLNQVNVGLVLVEGIKLDLRRKYIISSVS